MCRVISLMNWNIVTGSVMCRIRRSFNLSIAKAIRKKIFRPSNKKLSRTRNKDWKEKGENEIRRFKKQERRRTIIGEFQNTKWKQTEERDEWIYKRKQGKGRRRYLCWQCINEEREEPVERYHCDVNAVSIKMTTKHRKLLRHQVFENKLEYKRGKFEYITTTCVKCFWW